MSSIRVPLRAFAVLALFTLLAGDAWRYATTWFGWVALILLMGVGVVILLVRGKARWSFDRVPYPLSLFMVLLVLSTAWSAYPAFTAVGSFSTVLTVAAAVAFAVTFTRSEFLALLGMALRLVLGLSLLFELVVAIFVRHPILPWWADYSGQTIHAAYYWSRDVLFTGGRIQGIMGNSNLLGFAALLGLIVFALQLAARTVRPVWGILWLAVAAACILLTRSATVTVAIAVVAIVTVILLLLRRARTSRGRLTVSIVSLVLVLIGVVGSLVFQRLLFAALGKSDDLTGRVHIWNFVIGLARERPAFGWGWLSYWVPFVEPFKGHAVLHGVQYLQAHDAWLDVWLQVGIVGLVIFAALVVSTLVRAWTQALDRPTDPVNGERSFTATSLLPILLLVALLAQSIVESRLLLEYGMFLLAYIAVSTKIPDRELESSLLSPAVNQRADAA
jgi:exopolysaccharide production protein ExoQ